MGSKEDTYPPFHSEVHQMWETKLLPPRRRASKKTHPGARAGLVWDARIHLQQESEGDSQSRPAFPEGIVRGRGEGRARGRLGGHTQHGVEYLHSAAGSGRFRILLATQVGGKLRHDGICPQSHRSVRWRAVALRGSARDGDLRGLWGLQLET